jgi:hypothetical protein
MSRTGVLIDCWWRWWAGNCRPFLTHARNIFRCTDDTVHRTLSFRVSGHPPNIKNRDVPHLRQNVLQLFAVFITFQTGLAIPFYYMSPEGLQVLVTKLRISGDGVGKTVVVRQSNFRQT